MNISLTGTNVQHYHEQLHAALMKENTLVFVHAHWCPFTVQFYPVWRAVKKTLYGNTTLKIYDIDDKAIDWIRHNKKQLYQRIAEQFKPDPQYKVFFPTLLMYVNGRRHKFIGDRTQNAVIVWINNWLAKSQTHVRTSIKRHQTTKKAQHTKSVKTPLQSLQENIDNTFRKLLLK